MQVWNQEGRGLEGKLTLSFFSLLGIFYKFVCQINGVDSFKGLKNLRKHIKNKNKEENAR